MTAPLTRRLWIDGIAWWSPSLHDWMQAQVALRGDGGSSGTGDDSAEPPAHTARPAPTLLAANERRRAPDAVLLALEVATRAAASSGHDPATLASIFASAHGDLAITDALCRTLSDNPLLLSPTRFHHSVHNAASGYWAIGSRSPAASTALAAFDFTFASALLEAACQCHADEQPVMLVACDTEAVGPLASVNRSRSLLAVALVLSPVEGPQSSASLDWSLQAAAVAQPQPASAAAQRLARNASAAALPLIEALAAGHHGALAWPLSADLSLHIQLNHPLNRPVNLKLQARPAAAPGLAAA